MSSYLTLPRLRLKREAMFKLSRRRLLVGGAATGAVVGCGGGGVNTTPVFNSNGGPAYTLTVQYSNHTYGGKQVRVRSYGSIPGPTLTVSPGQSLTVTLNNQLPPDPSATVPTKVAIHPSAMGDMMSLRQQLALPAVTSTTIDPMNNPHLFNTTNLHVHGLQVVPHIFDPPGTSDPAAMQIAVSPGTSRTYTFNLPPDQPSGLFWYHPHHHGSSDVEVSSGMAGLILVKGPIDQVPEIAAARDIPIAVQTLQLKPDPSQAGLYSLEYVAYQTPQNGGYTPRTPNIFVLVNGQLVNFLSGLTAEAPALPVSAPSPPPVTMMQPGEVVRLRILNGSNALLFPIVLPGFDVYLIANDGVNVLAPQLIAPGSNVQIASGNRTELLVRAPQTPGTYTLSALAVPDASHPWPQFDFMQFVVSGSPLNMAIPASRPTPPRMYPPIADSEIAASRTVTFNSVGSTAILSGTALTINGNVYDEMAIFATLQTGTAQRWTLVNGMSEGHPYHIHTNSFEVHSVSSPTGGTITYNPPYICDTVWIPPNGTVIIQSRYKQWTGKDVFHCHKLTHEDQGMMANTMLT